MVLDSIRTLDIWILYLIYLRMVLDSIRTLYIWILYLILYKNGTG